MLVFRSSNWCQGLDAFINLYLQSEPNSAQVSREASLVLGAVISFALAWVSTDIARPPQRHLVAFGTIVLLIT
ncbi:MAG: hypothetical protein NZL93_05680, partial [Chthoniobacterales bacterium]|nr:hypothetical protein [Chthoniobacterales bacterium]